MQAQYLIPMAITICSGVFVASFLTLILVPCLLGILSDLRVGAYGIWHGHRPEREALEPGIKRREVESWVSGAQEIAPKKG